MANLDDGYFIRLLNIYSNNFWLFAYALSTSAFIVATNATTAVDYLGFVSLIFVSHQTNDVHTCNKRKINKMLVVRKH